MLTFPVSVQISNFIFLPDSINKKCYIEIMSFWNFKCFSYGLGHLGQMWLDRIHGSSIFNIKLRCLIGLIQLSWKNFQLWGSLYTSKLKVPKKLNTLITFHQFRIIHYEELWEMSLMSLAVHFYDEFINIAIIIRKSTARHSAIAEATCACRTRKFDFMLRI
jgi:hypothetical protein